MPRNIIDAEVLARKLAGETLCHRETALKFVLGQPVRGLLLNQQLRAAEKKILREHNRAALAEEKRAERDERLAAQLGAALQRTGT